MTAITDPTHLERLLTSLATTAGRLAKAWADEHEGAYQPRGGGGRTTNAAHSPTEAIAVQDRKHQHRDRIGAAILRAERTLTDAAADLLTRHPGGPCSCCGRETATHGHNDDGTPVDCYRCHYYLRRTGRRCTDDIHDGRGYVRMCDCPTWCCEVCSDRAAEGRNYSERCKRRMAPDRRGPTATV